MTLAACAGGPEPEERPETLAGIDPEREFHLLVGEVALQRGRVAQSAEHYAAAAERDERPGIARQATVLAWRAELYETAQGAARRWQQLSPESSEANRYLGALALREGDVERAAEHFARALEHSGERGAVFTDLLSLLSEEPRKRTAERLMRGLAADYPDEPRAQYALAQLALEAGRPETALEAARRLESLAPQWVEGRLTLARALVAARRPDEAAEVIAGLAEEENSPERQPVMAEILLEAGHAEAARDLLERAVERNPEEPGLTRALALVELQAGALEAAYEHFNELRQRTEYRAEAHYFLGHIEAERERWLQAIRYFSRVTSGERVVDAQRRAAQLYRETSGLDAALEHLRGFAAASPEHADAMLVQEAQLLAEAGREQEALARFEEPLAEQPDSETLRQGRAGVYAAIAQRAAEAEGNEAALRWYERGLEAHPESTMLRYERALLYGRMGEERRSLRELERLVEIEPDSPIFLNALGYLLADRTDDYGRAEELIDAALEYSPRDPATLDSKGWVRYRRGDLEGAMEYLQRAWSQLNDPEVAAHLIEVHMARGEESRAREMLEQALQRWPSDGRLEPWAQRLEE